MKLLYRAIRKLYRLCLQFFSKIITVAKFKGNGVKWSSFTTKGIPYVDVWRGGYMETGKGFSMNNSLWANPIAYVNPCTFVVGTGARLTIGDNVGISQTAIICLDDVTIKDNVKIGGGTALYTSDFHSLDKDIRRTADDLKCRKNAPIVIGNDVFIGAGCKILKGVTIGDGSIVGAGSVVTKSIPEGEIWAGNPARFIRKI